jgi:hypothetical protein
MRCPITLVVIILEESRHQRCHATFIGGTREAVKSDWIATRNLLDSHFLPVTLAMGETIEVGSCSFTVCWQGYFS